MASQPPKPPRGPLMAESTIAIHVMHYQGGALESEMHVTGPLVGNPAGVVAMLTGHAKEVADTGKRPRIVRPDGEH